MEIEEFDDLNRKHKEAYPFNVQGSELELYVAPIDGVYNICSYIITLKKGESIPSEIIKAIRAT